MRLLPLVLLIAAAPLAAGDAPPPSAPAMSRLLAGRVAEPARSCITQMPNMRSHIVDRQAILYEGVGRIYVNDFDGQGCSALRQNRTIVSVTPGTQLCGGDIVRVVDTVIHFDYGACTLGKFTPYARAKR